MSVFTAISISAQKLRFSDYTGRDVATAWKDETFWRKTLPQSLWFLFGLLLLVSQHWWGGFVWGLSINGDRLWWHQFVQHEKGWFLVKKKQCTSINISTQMHHVKCAFFFSIFVFKPAIPSSFISIDWIKKTNTCICALIIARCIWVITQRNHVTLNKD